LQTEQGQIQGQILNLDLVVREASVLQGHLDVGQAMAGGATGHCQVKAAATAAAAAAAVAKIFKEKREVHIIYQQLLLLLQQQNNHCCYCSNNKIHCCCIQTRCCCCWSLSLLSFTKICRRLLLLPCLLPLLLQSAF